MTTQYKTTKTSTKRLDKTLQDVIAEYVTYVDMNRLFTNEYPIIVKANKLIESLKVRVK